MLSWKPKFLTKERIIQSIPVPLSFKLGMKHVFDPESDIPNEEILAQHFKQEGKIDETSALHIIRKATELLCFEKNLIRIEEPVTICGDIHGQLYDLLHIFNVVGSPSSNTYLFLGNYVNRGQFGIECVLYLFALKLCYFSTFFLLRGNHESRFMTEHLNFKHECLVKYSEEVYEACMTAFDCLPLAALVDQQLFCVHGGLSPQIHILKDIENIVRFQEPPAYGPMCDLLWSDPSEDFDNKNSAHFTKNSKRNCSYSFNYEACCKFLKRNSLLTIIKSNEIHETGYRIYKKCDKTEFSSLITIFSAPNHADIYNNKAAIIKFKNNILNVSQFDSSAHPYCLPNYMDAFTWSLPFIYENVTLILIGIMSTCCLENDCNELDDSETSERAKHSLKDKLRKIEKIKQMFTVIREEHEFSLYLGGLSYSRNNTLQKKQKHFLTKLRGFSFQHKRIPFRDVKIFDNISQFSPKVERRETLDEPKGVDENEF